MEDAFVQGVSKILLAVSAVIGGSFLTLLKHWQSRSVQADLCEKLDQAVSDGKSYLASQLFALIYGLKMPFSDIQSLLSRDDSVTCIDALKRRQGVICYSRGSFSYHKLNAIPWFRVTGFASYVALAVLMLFLMFSSFVLLFFSKGLGTVYSLLAIALLSAGFAFCVKDLYLDLHTRRLVNELKSS
ncbi:hypothetical protein [uncultured Alcanivorax sp.]|jgi:hypothetical protein|uniref:hypothetical protein n=1 Tax=uncultured Alcanivorax sp. TaxID=191215 RepID=UPI0030DB53B0